MRVAQRVRHLASDLESFVDRELTFPGQALAQRFSLDIGHDIIEQPVGFIRVVQRQDVRVVETGGDLNLLEKPGCPERRGQLGPEHLQGNRALILQILGEEDVRHSPVPHFPLDLVTASER